MADIIAGFALPEADLDLVAELREGSEQAFSSLLNLYQQPIYNFVYRLLEDPSDAPDVTQEVFFKVFRKIGDFRGECSLKTWIYRIAVNEASNLRRWFGRHRRREVSLDQRVDDAPSLAELLADPQETQYEQLLLLERRRAVETALAEVKESFRIPVVMRDIEGLSYDEIAEILQVSLGTVKSRILRGREALKRKLAATAASGEVEALCPVEQVESV